MTGKVINKYHFGNKVPPGAINIMRGTVYGNPFPISDTLPREECIRAFELYLFKKIQESKMFARSVLALKDQTLCCCCAPKACHGDVLLKAANWLSTDAGKIYL